MADANTALTGAMIGALLVDLLVVAAMVRDWRVRGRPHQAYVIGLTCTILVQAIRKPFAQTGLWESIANGLAALAV